MSRKLDNRCVEYRSPIDLMDHPSDMKIWRLVDVGIKEELTRSGLTILRFI